MFPAEYNRIVRPENIHYAEIYWPQGELGAPCLVWWDLAMCELRLKQWSGTNCEPALVEAVNALTSLKIINIICVLKISY